MIQAFYLNEAGYSVRVIEKENRLGGLLGSRREEGFLIEQAANAFIANGELERVAKIIGVELVEKTPTARKRFIYRKGKMRKWPLNVKESFPLLQFFISRKWKNPKFSPRHDESLYHWSLRNLGEGLTNYLIEPGIQGVYASSLSHLSASLVLESLFKKHRKGRLVGSVSPKGGMQEWIDALKKYLKKQNVVFETNTEARSFDFSKPHIFAVGLNTLKNWGNRLEIPVHQSVLQTQCASLTSVTLGFHNPKHRLNEGFGCLFPRQEGFKALGVLFNHSIFPGRVKEGASETWIYNDEQEEFSLMGEGTLLQYVLSDREKLGERVEPDVVSISQWPGRIPLYNAALQYFLEEQEKGDYPYLLVGNYLGSLGLSKILFIARRNVELIEGGRFG